MQGDLHGLDFKIFLKIEVAKYTVLRRVFRRMQVLGSALSGAFQVYVIMTESKMGFPAQKEKQKDPQQCCGAQYPVCR